MQDNFPDMEVTAQDLSPYYLAEARSNAEHWRDVRQPGANLGGYEGTGFNFLQAAAEAMPVADNTFDVVRTGRGFKPSWLDLTSHVSRLFFTRFPPSWATGRVG